MANSSAPTTMREQDAAKAHAASLKTASRGSRKKMSLKYKILLIFISLILMGLLRTGFMFVIIGLMPSVVTYYMDVSSHRYAFRTILCCNLAGMLPSIGKMLHSGPTSALLQNIMGSPSNWVIIYGSGLAGWLLVEICPMIAQMMIVSGNQTQIARIKRLQKKIESEWGHEVTELAANPNRDD